MVISTLGSLLAFLHHRMPLMGKSDDTLIFADWPDGLYCVPQDLVALFVGWLAGRAAKRQVTSMSHSSG
jgi:hypothetical protein